MRSSARSALPALLTCLFFATSVFAQSLSKQQPAKTSRGSISGRITIKEKPVQGVVVGLRKGALESSYDPFDRAVTDAEGIYRINNLPAGNYVVTVAAPAYVPTNAEDRKSVVVGDDENVEGVNFSLVRGGVITGKVTDADGRPVMLHPIEIYTLSSGLDRREPPAMPYPAMTGNTDDRGIYRIFGIAPGSYKVAAGRGAYGGYTPGQSNYKQIFHPAADDPVKGAVIEVSEGSEAKDIDITLGRTVQTFSASGRIINSETNSSVPNLRFSLQRLIGQQRVEYVSTVVSSNSRGDFIVEGLKPGKYSTILFFNEGNDLRSEPTMFDVIDQDVSGVIIKLSRGASISGVVIVESENKAVQGKLAEMQVRGYVPVAPGTGYPNAVSSKIAMDGSFRLAGLANGLVNISLSGITGAYPPKGFSISRIERDGMPTPRIEVKDTEPVSGVKIFVAYGTATLRGSVKIENGPLPSGARVFVRLGKPGENTSYIRPPVVDERGNFFMDGLPSGQYEITATVMGGMNKPKAVKQEASLTDGIVTDVRITIDVANPGNP